jgi:hypothetical protein
MVRGKKPGALGILLAGSWRVNLSVASETINSSNSKPNSDLTR